MMRVQYKFSEKDIQAEGYGTMGKAIDHRSTRLAGIRHAHRHGQREGII